MAAPEIEERFLIAGHEYGDALERLGLEPHALFWAYDQIVQHHVLVLVTDFFDLKGPLEISRHLFRAYNASATPSEIDPFVVRIHSINQPAGEEYFRTAGLDWKFRLYDRDMVPKPLPPEASIASMVIADLEMRPGWILRAKGGKGRKSVELNRRWDRFSRNLDKLAA